MGLQGAWKHPPCKRDVLRLQGASAQGPCKYTLTRGMCQRPCKHCLQGACKQAPCKGSRVARCPLHLLVSAGSCLLLLVLVCSCLLFLALACSCLLMLALLRLLLALACSVYLRWLLLLCFLVLLLSSCACSLINIYTYGHDALKCHQDMKMWSPFCCLPSAPLQPRFIGQGGPGESPKP